MYHEQRPHWDGLDCECGGWRTGGGGGGGEWRLLGALVGVAKRVEAWHLAPAGGERRRAATTTAGGGGVACTTCHVACTTCHVACTTCHVARGG